MKTKLLRRLRRRANARYSLIEEFDSGWNYEYYYYIKRYDLLVFSCRVAGYYTRPEPLEPILEQLRQEEFERLVERYKERHTKKK